jgi:hypothetical protein
VLTDEPGPSCRGGQDVADALGIANKGAKRRVPVLECQDAMTSSLTAAASVAQLLEDRFAPRLARGPRADRRTPGGCGFDRPGSGHKKRVEEKGRVDRQVLQQAVLPTPIRRGLVHVLGIAEQQVSIVGRGGTAEVDHDRGEARPALSSTTRDTTGVAGVASTLVASVASPEALRVRRGTLGSRVC